MLLDSKIPTLEKFVRKVMKTKKEMTQNTKF